MIICLSLFSLLFAKSKTDGEYIFTEGYGKIQIKPNYVEMFIGVSTTNFNADTSLIRTNMIIDTLLSILTKYGIKSENIETHSAKFIREYEDNRDTSTYLGIKNECILKVKYFDVDTFEELLNKLISKGMNVLQSYEFKHTDEDSLKRVAAQIAFTESYKNAEAISMKSTRKLGKLLNVSYEKPDDYSIRPDFVIELSRDLIGNLMGGDGGGGLRLKIRQDLKYLRIIIPTIAFENNVYTKFELK